MNPPQVIGLWGIIICESDSRTGHHSKRGVALQMCKLFKAKLATSPQVARCGIEPTSKSAGGFGDWFLIVPYGAQKRTGSSNATPCPFLVTRTGIEPMLQP